MLQKLKRQLIWIERYEMT